MHRITDPFPVILCPEAQQKGTVIAMDDLQFIPRSASVPEGAAFSLTLQDSAMAPFFPEGTTVYVDVSRAPDEFQAGIFYYQGQVLCRQWCEDMTGTLFLLPADPASEHLSVSVPPAERGNCLCLGAVISAETLPAPIY